MWIEVTQNQNITIPKELKNISENFRGSISTWVSVEINNIEAIVVKPNANTLYFDEIMRDMTKIYLLEFNFFSDKNAYAPGIVMQCPFWENIA